MKGETLLPLVFWQIALFINHAYHLALILNVANVTLKFVVAVECHLPRCLGLWNIPSEK